MKVDLRDKLKKAQEMRELPDNHRTSFEQRLQKELHQKPRAQYSFFRIAATLLILVSLGFGGYQFFKPNNSQGVVVTKDAPDKQVNTMADIAPELKKVENYYLTQINYQISKITITDENKELLEVYLAELSGLQNQYNDLKSQLNGAEITADTLDALIENLQLRLQLLRQLKKKLDIIENIKLQENESKQA
ncbi:MAG: hypothetical protein OEM04_01030 [Flavobacteriaceae bacterium]|nr:hypothetical protein [Flavobacteriaceae bacterium]